ncbi:MAG TPA: adenylate/guanylate cyclase domain-containing protein [Chitinophagales bacterium]|nr:adenylate/guanylate cyclase domain-containing protein [Chitinophagales bacterium]
MPGSKMRCIILIFFLPLYCIAQQSAVDSLKKVIANAANDTSKVNTLIELSANYLNNDPDAALKYATDAQQLAHQLNFRSGEGWALKKIGQVYNIQGKYAEALESWKQALTVFEASGIKVGTANMLNNIGVIYYNKSLEIDALDYYLRSLKVSEEIRDTLRIATALMNVGTVYSNKPATYEKAIDFYRRALPLSESIHDQDAIGTSLVNIGEIYYQWNKNDSAIIYMQKAREAFTGSANLPYALNGIGKIYLKKNEFSLSLEYHQAAFDTAKQLDAKLDMAQALLGMAKTEKASGDLKQALLIYEQAQAMFRDIGSDATYDLKDTYEGMADAYAKIDDFSNAFHYQALLTSIKDTLYNLEVDKKLGTKLFAFEIEKKQGEIDLQQAVIAREKLIRNGFIGGFAIVLLSAGLLFYQRNRIAKEKRRSDELLLNILPAETAEELKATGTAKAKSFDSVSVLFTDFKDFTQATERLLPEELVAEINYCYSEFDKIITTFGLEKIKTSGDSYMCAGGLPVTNQTHPDNVVKAGLAMQRFIEENKQARMQQGLHYFDLRLGIHSGPVVAGIVGIKKFAYDIWGDTVNTASRMESSGEIGKVNISGATYELIKERFRCTYRGKIQAKNKGEIDMYFVDGIL